VLGSLAHLLTQVPRSEEARGLAHEAIAIAAQVGDVILALRTIVNHSDGLLMAGRLEEAATVALDGIRQAHRLGLARSSESVLACNTTKALMALGRWEQAEQISRRIWRPAPPVLPTSTYRSPGQPSSWASVTWTPPTAASSTAWPAPPTPVRGAQAQLSETNARPGVNFSEIDGHSGPTAVIPYAPLVVNGLRSLTLGRVPLVVEKQWAWFRVGMLGGGRDGLVDHLPIG
jgi:hypothetical protein